MKQTQNTPTTDIIHTHTILINNASSHVVCLVYWIGFYFVIIGDEWCYDRYMIAVWYTMMNDMFGQAISLDQII